VNTPANRSCYYYVIARTTLSLMTFVKKLTSRLIART